MNTIKNITSISELLLRHERAIQQQNNYDWQYQCFLNRHAYMCKSDLIIDLFTFKPLTDIEIKKLKKTEFNVFREDTKNLSLDGSIQVNSTQNAYKAFIDSPYRFTLQGIVFAPSNDGIVVLTPSKGLRSNSYIEASHRDLIEAMLYPNSCPSVYCNSWFPTQVGFIKAAKKNLIPPVLAGIKCIDSKDEYILNWIALMIQRPRKNHQIIPQIIYNDYNVHQIFDLISQLVSNVPTANVIKRSGLLNEGNYRGHLFTLIKTGTPFRDDQYDQERVISQASWKHPSKRFVFLTKTNIDLGLSQSKLIRKIIVREQPRTLNITPDLLNQLYSFFKSFEINESVLFQKQNHRWLLQ